MSPNAEGIYPEHTIVFSPKTHRINGNSMAFPLDFGRFYRSLHAVGAAAILAYGQTLLLSSIKVLCSSKSRLIGGSL
jgi:hypothetical protein